MFFQLLCLTFALVFSRSASQNMTAKSTTCISANTKVTLSCHTTDFAGSILFYLNGINKGGCVSSTCMTGIAGYVQPTQSGGLTDMVISAYDHSRDGGSWTCSYGALTSSPYILALGFCPTVTTEMSSTGTSQDQITSSQNPSVDSFLNTEKIETTIMTTTDNDLTSASSHVSSEVTTQIKTESDNLTDIGVSAIVAIAISGFIFLFLIILVIMCCCQYYREKSKKKTIEKFQEIGDYVVPESWPNFNGHINGLNNINGSTVHLARGYNLYRGEYCRGYNVPSTNQSDNYNRSRSYRKNITVKRTHEPKQGQEKIRHGFPQSIPDDIMNRHDINGIHFYPLHDNNQNTKTYYREQGVSSARRLEHRGYFSPHEYINHNRNYPYMTYLHQHAPLDMEGLTIYKGQRRATNKGSKRYNKS